MENRIDAIYARQSVDRKDSISIGLDVIVYFPAIRNYL